MYAKKTFKKQPHEKYKYERTIKVISKHKITLDRLTWRWNQSIKPLSFQLSLIMRKLNLQILLALKVIETAMEITKEKDVIISIVIKAMMSFNSTERKNVFLLEIIITWLFCVRHYLLLKTLKEKKLHLISLFCVFVLCFCFCFLFIFIIVFWGFFLFFFLFLFFA